MDGQSSQTHTKKRGKKKKKKEMNRMRETAHKFESYTEREMKLYSAWVKCQIGKCQKMMEGSCLSLFSFPALWASIDCLLCVVGIFEF